MAGELSGNSGFEEHFGQCPVCRDAVEAIRRIHETLRWGQRRSVSRDLTPAILASIRAESRPARFPRVAAIAAAFVLLAGAAMLTVRDATPARDAAPDLAKTGADRAVDWLCAHQQTDGSWDAKKWGGQERFRIALTALPMLALEASGGASPEHVAAVRRSAAWLRAQQRVDGTFGAEFSGAPYNRSIATLALVRASDWEADAASKEAVSRAVAALLTRQTPDGGWAYEFSARPDRSITEWHVEALEAAAARGCREVLAQLDRGRAWLAAHAAPPENADEPADSPSETLPQSPEVALDFYGAYFMAMRPPAQDDRSSGQRLAGLRRALLMQQITGGSDAGTWAPDDRWGRAGGRLYSTALAAMTLRVR